MSEGNPNIAEIGKNYGFGAPNGTDPREARAKANPPWSVRHAIKRIAACPDLDIDRGAPSLMRQIKTKVFNGKMSGGEILAAQKFIQAMTNYKAMKEVTEDIDGKLVERKVEAKVSLADLVNGSYESDGSFE